VPVYLHTCARLGLPEDAAKLEEMRAKNAQTLKELDERCATLVSAPPHHPCVTPDVHLPAPRSITDAEANLGESEVREALLAKANFFVKIGDKARRWTHARVLHLRFLSRCLVQLPSAGGRGGSCGDGEEGASPGGSLLLRESTHTPPHPAQTVAVGHKMDLVFTALMLHLTFTDWLAVKRDIKKVRTSKKSCHGVMSHTPADTSMPPRPTS
jgi:hypothetical protein